MSTEEITKKDIQESINVIKKSDFIIGVHGHAPGNITWREEEMINIVNETPNDMELGKILRSFINQNLK